MTELAKKILHGIKAETDRLKALSQTAEQYNLPTAEKAALRDLRDGRGVALDFATWTRQQPTPAHRQRCHRTLLQLEASGLVELGRKWGGRVTHVSLAQEGERLARSLEAPGRAYPGCGEGSAFPRQCDR